MPPKANLPNSEKSLEEVIDELGVYPVDAFVFLQEGLSYTVQKIHGARARDNTIDRHVSGQMLCEGLRDLAIEKWGFMARTVLAKWSITCSMDFGRMVFAMVEAGLMHKTDDDTLDDFRNVFDFEKSFEKSYRIPRKPSLCQ
jgi:uncharacterized repeat protein (TIGR04138 family)